MNERGPDLRVALMLGLLSSLLLAGAGPISARETGEAPARALLRAGGSLVLAKYGVAYAAIVIPEEKPAVAGEAATVLQQTIARMTGVTLPILTEGEPTGGAAVLLVGRSKLARKLGVNLAQDRLAGERYIIRSVRQGLVLAGNDGGELRGTIHAVYDLLQRLGCGWYGPDPAWHVIPEVKTLAVPALRVDERPAFALRQIWNMPPVLRDAWRVGGRQISHAHALSTLVPERYREDHPDWFGPGQPDITHPEVIALVVEQFRAQLDAREGVIEFSISANDTGGWADNERTRRIGNPAAQSLYFANAISRELRISHPGRYLLTFYAYWFTHEVPETGSKAEPGICVMQVNEGNRAKAWNAPEPEEIAAMFFKSNTREMATFDYWRRSGATLGIYDWWIPAFEDKTWQRLPWYPGETLLRNFRYWQKGGVRFVSAEVDYEKEPWPLRWPLYYVGARGLWNPKVKASEIMREACDKLYGPASAPMQQFYALLEQAMADTPLCQQNWNLPAVDQVYTPEIETSASALLEQAAAATDEPAALARIDQETAMWNTTRELSAQIRRGEGPTYHWRPIYVDGKFMYWRQPDASVEIVRSLFGIPDNIPVYHMKTDGAKTLTADKDTFDLTTAPPRFVTR